MKTQRRLLLPAALVVTAGSGCSPPAKPACGTEASHACWPDGGYACPSECGAVKQPDGGLQLDSMGMPQCLC